MREVFHCHPGDPVAPAMAVMIRRGLSHVPILQNRIVQGVFSESTVFAYLVQKKLSGLPEGLRFSDLSEYLHAPTRRSEIYRFLSPEAPPPRPRQPLRPRSARENGSVCFCSPVPVSRTRPYWAY